MGSHIVDGKFQSDKYPTCKVPLSVNDSTAQDLLWEYAQRRRAKDAEFASDLEAALVAAGYAPWAFELPNWQWDRGDEKSGKASLSLIVSPGSWQSIDHASYHVRGERWWTTRLSSIDGSIDLESSERFSDSLPGDELTARREALDATILFAERLLILARAARRQLATSSPGATP